MIDTEKKQLQIDLEKSRVRALDALGIIGSPTPPEVEAVVKKIKAHYDIPLVSIAFMHESFTWFMVKPYRYLAQEIPKSMYLNHTEILRDLPIIVNSMAYNENWKKHFLVTGPPYMRFMASTTIKTKAGYRIAQLGIADVDSRPDFLLGDADYLVECAREIEKLLAI